MKEIYSQIEIGATPNRIWQILLDFESYPKWNPYIRFANGTPAVGKRIEIVTHPKGSRKLIFHPLILKLEANNELRWRGSSLPGFLFSGEHIFLLRSKSHEITSFVQREIFTGLLVPFLQGTLDKRTLRGFQAMNAVLKIRAEE
jgi:hypothetical protein